MARYLSAALLGVDEIEQMALIARMSSVWIAVIDTGQGVLEGGLWLPRGVDRTTVSALLNETEFFFEQFENVAIVISHFTNLQFSLASTGQRVAAVVNSINLGTHAITKSNVHAESHSQLIRRKVRV